MAMTPMIVIGCGGSGGKVITSLRQTLELNLRNLGWTEGLPEAWQLIYIDTPAGQEVNADFGPPVPPRDYVSVSEGEDVYRNVDDAVMRSCGPDGIGRFIGWRPSPAIALPLARGAGQWRAVGRVAAFNGLPSVARRIERAIGETVAGKSQLERLGALVGDDAPVAGDPFIVIVSSLAGGTGAGIFLDVADVVRTVKASLQNRIVGVLFTAEVFKNLNNVPGVQPNTIAALSEMMAGYFDSNREPEPLFKGHVTNPAQVLSRAGINYPFVVGMSTIAGTQLERTGDAYRAVTETLAAALINPAVAQGLFNWQITNWSNEQQDNTTAWQFGNAKRSDLSVVDSGVVSSFGSARLSVGVARFGEYAVHRLSRSVVEYLSDGYIQYGRALLNDPQASPEQIIAHLVNEHALKFVEACGLREQNDPVEGEHNQVLDSVLSNDELSIAWKEWWQQAHRELQTLPPSTSAHWLQQITNLVPTITKRFLADVTSRCEAGEQELMRTLPQQMMAEVSRAIAQYGVPVTSALVKYTHEHVQVAIKQLKEEAATERSTGSSWSQQAGEQLGQIPPDTKLPPANDVVQEAVRRACGGAYRDARATARETTAAFLQRYSDMVLLKLVAMLEQVQGQLAGNNARTAVAGWPTADGIPEAFAPPPLEYCLVDPNRWSGLYTNLLGDTTDDEEVFGSAEEVARRVVGGGGFKVERDGVVRAVDVALEVTERWTGGPVTFTSRFEVDHIRERARLWLTRRGSVFGDFLDQRLGGYLSGVQNGQPVADLQARLDRFQDGLQRTLAAATPLVHIDPAVLRRVHPLSKMPGRMTKLIAEKLPLPGGPARDIATRIFATHLDGNTPVEDYFGDGTFDVEGVLYVSRLSGAVHPAAVTSLMAPVATTWNRVRKDTCAIGPYWQNRRARLLAEFIPVAPMTLESMIRGWFVGRLLGVISDPDPRCGFRIGYTDNGSVKQARFPWPLLRSGTTPEITDNSLKLEWLPALLETIPIGFSLVSSEPDILDGYDQMALLGQSNALTRWVTTGESPAAICRPQVSGETLDARRDDALAKLSRLRKPYDDGVANRVVVSNPSQFFAIPYGFDLYDRFREAFDALTDVISTLTDTPEEVG